ncbi:hypothetical protein [Fibrobacter intestinalis]|nr:MULTISPECIES: hypothetical protein [Fibrobacter]
MKSEMTALKNGFGKEDENEKRAINRLSAFMTLQRKVSLSMFNNGF